MSTKETVLTLALAMLCCALPILLLSGLSIGSGVLRGELALVVVGVVGIGYAIYKVTRGRWQ